ncbi:cytochrome C [hot springs metagenome]|uniref:Cytochrome C n=1 Tax=hot springs metagenome TaxID=433727 RepID=A0A5J4L5U0_9ZZZZ
MKIGTISDYINKKTVIIFVVQFLLVITILSYKAWKDTSVECIRCHSDKEKMTKLGYPQFYMTQEMVEKQSNHPNVKCHECHLGDGRAKEPDKAHKGMLAVLLIDDDGNVLKRKDVYPEPLLPSGNDMIRNMLPKVRYNGELLPHPDVRNVLWHDRNPETFNFDPDIAKKTCGKSGCHFEELKQFKTTIMATNFRQRTMRTWLEPYGPHNCGPSFADLLPSEVLRSAGFQFKNTEDIRKELNLPFSKEQATAKQKFCNICHAGCLDCHYEPDRKKGVHNFTNKPTSISCAGYGRGTSICHPGAMQSRRGETYIGGDYSIPTGMNPDVHYKKNIHCVDCHTTGEKGMGDMQRKASCQDCHIEIEEAHAKSIHKNMDCATCHISELRGYQITVWGPGLIASKENPFKKYSLYYGIQGPPILLKDQKGKWMPVKIWPHSVGNIKPDVRPSERIMFRWPNGETRDAYYLVGTFNAHANNKHLLWLEIQQASHPYGKARKCESCHKKPIQNSQQIAVSTWEFMDNQGAEPFKGGHRIIADKHGLRIMDMRNTTPIKLLEGYRLEDFASWIFFKDKWQMSGDFSIKAKKEKYNRYLLIANKLDNELKILDNYVKDKDKRIQKQFKELKGVVLHNQDGALERIEKFKKEL